MALALPGGVTRRSRDAGSGPAAAPELAILPLSKSADRGTVAILGWSLFAIEAMRRAERPFCVVGPPGFADYARHNDVPFVPCDLTRFDPSEAARIAALLARLGVDFAVPLYEPTVEWCGALNAVLRSRPKLAEWVLLFRNKAMMKRRAQLHDIPVGVFREAKDRSEVVEFLESVNAALLADEPEKPVHIKAFDEAGCKGHFVIRRPEDAEAVSDEAFPCLVESDLEGQEIACEVFIHDGEIVFMNISEYVHLGHSVFVPPGPALEERREDIREMNRRLIEAFEIDNGVIHPEWFLAGDGAIHFGEVAYRVPGGNAFELIERAYGFDPYEGQVLCMDPRATHEEVRAFFPREDRHRGHAGVLLVYPQGDRVSDVCVPRGLTLDPAFESHDLVRPGEREIERSPYFVNGTHWGNVYLFSDDPARIRRLCLHYEKHRFYR